MEIILGIIFFIIIMKFIGGIINFILFFYCPECKKLFRLQVKNEVLLDRKRCYIQELRTYNEYNSFTNKWETKSRWENVPGYEYIYKYFMICKKCGFSTEKIVSKKRKF